MKSETAGGTQQPVFLMRPSGASDAFSYWTITSRNNLLASLCPVTTTLGAICFAWTLTDFPQVQPGSAFSHAHVLHLLPSVLRLTFGFQRHQQSGVQLSTHVYAI